MNLIANTGIQLLTVPLEINMSNNFKMYFHEWYDSEEQQLKLEVAHFFSEDDIWVRKWDLQQLGYVNNNKVTDNWETICQDEEFNKSSIISIETDNAKDSGSFYETANRINWEIFENKWLPMPFFMLKGQQSDFGPTNWCRFKLIPTEINNKNRLYHLLLAFDTKSIFEKEDFENEDLNEAPTFTNAAEKTKKFALCNNEYKLLQYCSESYNCEWIDKYILKLFHGTDNIYDIKGLQKPKLDYLAQYIFINRYIQQFSLIPQITLYSNLNNSYSNVDLVVDIGNSRTCAVLFDDGDFTKSSPLELQDFTTPISSGSFNKYHDPFDMRLAFRKANFGGDLGLLNSRQFIYPSLVRLGKEANTLIHKAINTNTGAEKNSTFSSPKRFLWDSQPQKQEWEFVQLENEKAKPIYIEGISEQLNIDGSLNTDGYGEVLTHYSRKALMTFAFLEILSQANMQINSYEQRSYWGNESMPRKIRRIIVTCPTAMSNLEQIALRKCAEDAAIMLDRFYHNKYMEQINENKLREQIQVIPSAKQIKTKEERSEWIYDEATAAQFVFLYAEIKERYQKNVVDYFEFYGKVRPDLDDYHKKSLTIGSIDMGAGTTDVMIAAYKYDNNTQCSLTPVPLFWESFYKAGDDLLKELIHQLVIEGKYSPIEKEIRNMGKDPIALLQPFLGTDNGVSASNRQLRSEFNLQISVPIVSYFLELLKEDKDIRKTLSFNDIFKNNMPTTRLLSHFKNHFGFDFNLLKWHYDRNIVASIIEKTFDSLIGKISSLFSYHGCDIVLLSGRPMSLKPLSDLFLKYYPVSPNRLKSMNDYRVGRWYPEDKRYKFIDENGKFINPKSIVTTGAIIGELAGHGGLNGFVLNLTELIQKLVPTTNYFGQLNEESLEYVKTLLSLDNNYAMIEIPSLPFRIGVRQFDTASYPSRPFYTFNFNDTNIEDRIRGRLDDYATMDDVQAGIHTEKRKIHRSMPLTIKISRDPNEDLEILHLEEILDKDGNSLNKNFFTLQIQSMSEVENFWLDSGIFNLNINTTKY